MTKSVGQVLSWAGSAALLATVVSNIVNSALVARCFGNFDGVCLHVKQIVLQNSHSCRVNILNIEGDKMKKRSL